MNTFVKCYYINKASLRQKQNMKSTRTNDVIKIIAFGIISSSASEAIFLNGD
jgi:hypothetical protein